MVITKNENRTAVVRVILVEGSNISRTRSNGNKSGIFCTLQVGRQKEESDTVNDGKYPVWKNEFEFYLYEDGSEELQVSIKCCSTKNRKESYSNIEDIGKIVIDLSNLKPESMQDVWETVTREDNGEGGGKVGKLHFLITITGITSINSPFNAISEANNSRWDSLKISLDDKTNPSQFSSHDGYVGRLLVKVHKAEGLPASKYLSGKPDPFCLVSLGNDILRTQTIPKTLAPLWEKCFEFNVRDISDRLQFTVFDEETDKKYRALGTLKLPLLKVLNNGKMWYSLQEPIRRKQTKAPDDFKLQLEFLLIYNTSMMQCQVTW